MFLWSDAETAASQTTNDFHTVPVIGTATVPRGIDSEVHGTGDTVEGVRDGTRNVDNEQGIIEDLGAREIDSGANIIHN
jgi:hypothetical protein